jgi:hypothetical protein
MTENWVRSFTGTGRYHGEFTEDLDGVGWYEAGADMPKILRRFHWPHRPQTRGILGGGIGLIERCKCGAARVDRTGWTRGKGW